MTGLGTPVANLLVPDLIAYQGPGTSSSGPTVAPIQNAGLVDTGASDGGPMDEFSVFDVLTVIGASLGYDRQNGDGGVLSSHVAKTQGIGETIQKSTARDVIIASAPLVAGGSSMMPLDITTVLDAVLTGWSRPRGSAVRPRLVQGAATAAIGRSGRTPLITGNPHTPVLDTGSVDALLGDLGMLGSFLDLDGNGRVVKKKR